MSTVDEMCYELKKLEAKLGMVENLINQGSVGNEEFNKKLSVADLSALQAKDDNARTKLNEVIDFVNTTLGTSIKHR